MATASRLLGKLYAENEIIYRQGDSGDSMYIVQLGHVEIVQRKGTNEYCLAVLNEGDFFGDMALFGYPVRTATARAASGGASVLTLEKKAFMKRLHYDPSLALNMLKRMADRIHHLEQALVQYGEVQASLVKDPTAE
ncbi:MAG TPA: cyclic nucleotide-binding domain-containing protein [Candidatus Acidoferrum sp.]